MPPLFPDDPVSCSWGLLAVEHEEVGCDLRSLVASCLSVLQKVYLFEACYIWGCHRDAVEDTSILGVVTNYYYTMRHFPEVLNLCNIYKESHYRLHCRMLGKWWKIKWNRRGRQISWRNVRICLGICLEELMKSKKNVNQHSVCTDWLADGVHQKLCRLQAYRLAGCHVTRICLCLYHPQGLHKGYWRKDRRDGKTRKKT